MRAIVAVTKDWGIGYKGQLLVRNKADMQAFVRHTKGGTVIMGRTTLESFPGGKPLKGRRNIVLTRDVEFAREGVEVAHSKEEVFQLVAAEDPEHVWIIGGASVYQQFLPYCTQALITKNGCIRPADTYFEDLDKNDAWKLLGVECSGVTDKNIAWELCVYQNQEPLRSDWSTHP